MEEKSLSSRRESFHLLAGTAALGLFFERGHDSEGPQKDECFTDADGTDHVTRVVPVPGTISPEARKFISHPVSSNPPPPLAERRKHMNQFRATGRPFLHAYQEV